MIGPLFVERCTPMSDYVGAPVLRVEDERLLTGRGRYVADLALEGMAHLVVVRSTHPSARLRSIDTGAAAVMPGVLGVWTAEDIRADGLQGIPWELRPPVPPGTTNLPPQGDPSVAPPQPLLAESVVRYQGEPVAALVATSLERALDAAEAIIIDYEPLPAVFDVREAAKPDAVQVWDRFPGNVCFRVNAGDVAKATHAFTQARHVTTLSIHVPRLVQNPIETRTYVGMYDADGDRYTLHAAAGKPQTIGRAIANDIFRIPKERVRVIAKDVGGGFGAKNTLYAEEALVLWAAKKTGRPVRWVSSRADGFLSDMQARDQAADATLAFDASGKILGMRVRMLTNLGAYLGQRGATPPTLPPRVITGVYDIPALHYEGVALHTHTVPTCPYRGAGAPEAILIIERLMDTAARELGIAPTVLRRRNLIDKTSMPYQTAGLSLYDSGDFAAGMDLAEHRAGVNGFKERRAASEARGCLRGLGYANMMEACGYGIADKAEVSCLPDGSIDVRIGTMSNGQSHETVYAQILADDLGVPLERIRIIQGDSNETPDGWGTGASRSMTVGGSALVLAARKVIELGRMTAAEILEASPADLAYERGAFKVMGTDRVVRLEDVAKRLIAHGARPDRGLSAEDKFEPASPTYPNGCHIAEVEIDAETGVVQLCGYTMAQDVGKALNPMVVEGQLAGGVAQGVGEALFERVVLDPQSGQLLSGSFMDYPIPRADDLPSFDTQLMEIPCRHNPMGIKSCGEAGATASPAAVINAIHDALAPLGVTEIPIPATSEAILRVIQSSARKKQ
jgi:aerobic carbon-monoxide dehydrogenase large subunit